MNTTLVTKHTKSGIVIILSQNPDDYIELELLQGNDGIYLYSKEEINDLIFKLQEIL